MANSGFVNIKFVFNDKQVQSRLSMIASKLNQSPKVITEKICHEIQRRANENLMNDLYQPQHQFERWKGQHPTGGGPQPTIDQSWVITNKGNYTVLENTSPHAAAREYGVPPRLTPEGEPMVFYAYGRWIKTTELRGYLPSYFFTNAIKSTIRDIKRLTTEELVKLIPQLVR